MQHSDPLEAWVDESIVQSRRGGYNPTIFSSMRRGGTVAAMSKLVESGAIQSGFIRLRDMGMLEWTVETGILKFANRFTPQAQACAQFRIDHADDPMLRAG